MEIGEDDQRMISRSSTVDEIGACRAGDDIDDETVTNRRITIHHPKEEITASRAWRRRYRMYFEPEPNSIVVVISTSIQVGSWQYLGSE